MTREILASQEEVNKVVEEARKLYGLQPPNPMLIEAEQRVAQREREFVAAVRNLAAAKEVLEMARHNFLPKPKQAPATVMGGVA